ncbi:MAG TPA: glycosyltransferase family 39 protein [Chitinophagaceae bacterium]|nr:glycosyltransferase family 39 protein [Chitinophagaceae bacterium]HNU15102.1 glycosyltransferase family 39 protein [Chitinophagaceae bacterium]
MQQVILKNKLSEERFHLFFGITCLLLLILAYLSHLDFVPLNADHDEARRALVAGEMIFSGDYLTPTLNGEIYLNKPPLYNWLIIVYFKLFGNYSMFAFRLPVIVATIGMGITVYHFTKKYLSASVAFFTAFAFMTNGRIMIYDSIVGLIDTTFSWIVYISFFLIYHYGEKKKYYHLFLLTYLIAAAGFLMKGFPALVFQALSLLAYFIWKRKFNVLFHPAHFAGILLLVVITGSYYLAYLSVNDIALLDVFGNLMQESSKRTFMEHKTRIAIFHLFTFPLTFLYHFAPWTLFVVAFFQKGLWQKLKQNDFVYYSFVVLVVNIIIYWISPKIHPRYLFMFLPLFYLICFYLFFDTLDNHSWQHKVVSVILFVACFALLLTFLILPFLKLNIETSQPVLKSLVLVLLFALVVWAMFRMKQYRYYFFILAIIFFRFGFNWFVIESRGKRYTESKSVTEQIVSKTKGHDLFILRNAETGNFDGKSFQIMIGRKEILKFADSIRFDAFYIIDKHQAQGKKIEKFMSFNNFYPDTLMLVKFLPE